MSPWPTFFLVGAPRCGTTSMYTYLKQHPEIYLSVLKEPHFFSRDLTLPPQGVDDPELYLSLFDGVGEHHRQAGEGSVWYLESRAAPQAIRDSSPEARILVMLRDPIEMMQSLYSLYRRTQNESLTDFSAALRAQPERERGENLPSGCYFPEGLRYTQVALYSEKVERYFEVFGRNQVHVVLFDDFVGRPRETYRDVCRFLGVDDSFEPELDVARATRAIRPLVLKQLRTTAPEIRERMRGGGRRHAGPRRTDLTDDERRRLRDHFRPDVEALERLLDRDLGRWRAPR